MGQLFRYGLAAAGPIASALAQFVLTILLLRSVPASDFGAYAFLLVINQLAQGIWSALFCAPLLATVTQAADGDAHARIAAIFQLGLAGSLLCAAATALLALALHLSAAQSTLVAVLTVASLCRWLGRAQAYAAGRGARTNISDMLYAIALMAITGILAMDGTLSLTQALLILALATFVGWLPLLADYGRACRGLAPGKAWLHYRTAWIGQGRWALTGVVTTEATANAHAYIVTGLLGSTAFAPLAATALAIRPATVIVNALAELERAQMARAAADAGSVVPAARMVRFFRLVLALLWLANGLLILVLLLPSSPAAAMLPRQYPPSILAAGMILWMIVLACRLARAPDSALLQALDRYRPLAFASAYSCLFSLVVVTILTLLAGPLWSIAGVAVGEAAFAIWTHRAAKAQLQLDGPAT